MITLGKKFRKDSTSSQSGNTPQAVTKETVYTKRISIRDKLLVKEIQEMEHMLPPTCQVVFGDPNVLHDFRLVITPDEGFWKGGAFQFHITVTEEYNIAPPLVKCETKLWHPNIDENGEICLSILRQNSIDGMGWAPTRRIKDVIWGLNSLFTDLLNFDDPLNIEAADLYQRNKDGFQQKVREYVNLYAKR